MKRVPGVTAILVAAGAGRRLGGRGEKALRTLGGRPLVYHSLRTLERSPSVESVVLVVRRNVIRKCESFVRRCGLRKVRKVLAGGRRRQDSVARGLDFARASVPSELVLIHDAARPFLSERLIGRTISAAKRKGAAIAALPVSDTVKKVKGTAIAGTVPREGLWLAQTPQVFRRDLLERAFNRWHSGRAATDDASIVSGLGESVIVVEGESSNIKITYPEDMILAEAMLRLRRRELSGRVRAPRAGRGPTGRSARRKGRKGQKRAVRPPQERGSAARRK
ncbi:MAG: 2-C-methyl-D-erythritol 4-phosphate cytidylyltransferase [Candidatus Eisenbacteria bacterium]